MLPLSGRPRTLVEHVGGDLELEDLIVARQAVGDRCELFHEVNLMDIDLELGDVLSVDEVLDGLRAVMEGSAG